MRKNLFILGVLFLTTIVCGQKQLTLEEAYSIALQRNSGIIQSKNSLDYRETNVKSAYGDFLPSFGLNGSWDWSRVANDGSRQYVAELDSVVSFGKSQNDNRTWKISAGGSVTLFNGLANYANLRTAKNSLKSAKYDLEKLKQDVLYRTTDYYFTILNAKELLKVREDNVTYNQKLLETIQERNKLGSVPVADVYAQQVQLGNAQLALIQAQNTFEIAKSNLLNYLALDVLDEYRFDDPTSTDTEEKLEDEFENLNNLQALVKDAFKNRADLKSQDLLVNNAEESLIIQRSGLFPTLTGSYGFGTSGVEPGDLFDRRSYSIGLSLNVPIFSNWNTEAGMDYAKAGIKNERENLEALKRSIKIQVKQGYLDLIAAKKQLDVSSKNVISAEENRRINNERYNLGAGTILDVLQSDKDYTNAVSAMIDARYNYYKLKDNLTNILGKLDYKEFDK